MAKEKAFEIQTGKDWMRQVEVERQRQLRTGSRELTRGELEQNCAKLAQILNQKVPLDVGFVLVVTPRDSTEIGVTASNISDLEYVERVLVQAKKRVLKRRSSGDGN